MNVLLRKEAAEQLRISLNALTILVKKGAIKQVHLTKQRRGILQRGRQGIRNINPVKELNLW